MDNKLNKKIQDLCVEIKKIYDEINDKIFNFITKARELVELSEDDFQIEKTLELNKISLKGYVLESDCCITLSSNNIKNYSIDELRCYLNNYEKQFNDNCYKYFFALSLYELIEEIENRVDEKINLEIKEMSKLISNINGFKTINSFEYQNLYNNLKDELDNYYSSNIINEKSFNICNTILDDVINYYLNGYPTIPEDYLSQDEN